MHTYKTLTLDEAHLILDAAQKKAEELGVPEVLCVADNAGYPIALRRLDGGLERRLARESHAAVGLRWLLASDQAGQRCWKRWTPDHGGTLQPLPAGQSRG